MVAIIMAIIKLIITLNLTNSTVAIVKTTMMEKLITMRMEEFVNMIKLNIQRITTSMTAR